MARPITDKNVQVHETWEDGYNEVYPDTFPIKWADLQTAGIRRRKDQTTGKWFLFLRIEHANPFYGPFPDFDSTLDLENL